MDSYPLYVGLFVGAIAGITSGYGFYQIINPSLPVYQAIIGLWSAFYASIVCLLVAESYRKDEQEKWSGENVFWAKRIESR